MCVKSFTKFLLLGRHCCHLLVGTVAISSVVVIRYGVGVGGGGAHGQGTQGGGMDVEYISLLDS